LTGGKSRFYTDDRYESVLGKKRFDPMRYTIKDIASAANVSVSTVSKCLNGYGDIGDTTKQLVLDTIKRLDYVPNTFARYISTKATRVIGLTVPDIRDPYFAQSTFGIEECLKANGYELFLGNLDRCEGKFLKFVQTAREMRFDALIITPDFWTDEVCSALMHMDVPVLSIRRRPPKKCRMHYVDSNHYSCAMKMLGYLYQHGHRKIAHAKLPNEAGDLRSAAYTEFCKTNGMEVRLAAADMPASILADAVGNGKWCCRTILEKWPDTTAIFCGSDFIAVGVMAYLKEIGKRIPEDISVTGIGNVDFIQLPWLNLTTMELHRYEMGVRAANLLLNQLQGHEVEDVLFDATLVERGSVAPVE
jgi:LacI family transcriptional regulator